ncbi:MAG: UDP-N-acetylmuramate:L-alanyl-gamma-D-glutamyl-meso-diaminopimelate ligase [Deltaproteobacteria bacterium]|nr:UDP-N-acetylmuramate:L-alanyl-gamma-D-glutamyl-meso-diaminopimelate ligase [Deltaproteobacteria bacterium]
MPRMAEPKSIHLMGICGTGMGSFAGLLKAAGYQVRGSDQNVYPPMSDKLAAWGIEVREGYRPENLDPAPDLVVVGNVIRRTNLEAEAVMARNLPYTSFPKALKDLFLANKHSVVVAGTHGKTTTTSLVAWLLAAAGRDPGMLVGGVPANFSEGFRLGHGDHFVVEGDEYDTAYFDKVPKFVHYAPRTAIITSLEFDHADIYPDVAAIEREFDKLVALVPADGRIFACASDPRVLARVENARTDVATYTARPGVSAHWSARDIEMGPDGASFLLFNGNIRLGRFELPMAGLHNVENATAAIAVCLSLGLSVGEIRDGLASFLGIARRQTVRAVVDGVRIIDDFAHHPTAVRETVAAIRARYPEGRLFAIFEPRTATSARRHFQDAYAQAFDGADEIVIAQVGRSELPPEERLDVARLTEQLKGRGLIAHHIPEVDDIVTFLTLESRPQDTLLFMSNGGFGGIYTKIEASLAAR